VAAGASCEQLVDRCELRPAGDQRPKVMHLERDASGAALFAAMVGAIEHLLA
jgi:hypothetical protein